MAHILIIEDDEVVRKLLRRILELDGHEVTVAENGKIGVELFRSHGSDLVISDIIMPEMDGVETILNIRSDCPNAKIIAISGGGPKVGASTCLTLSKLVGAVTTLQKPVRRYEIITAVNNLLREA